MNIIIEGTNHRHTISIVDPGTGIDYAVDFIGNAGALDSFDWSDDHDAYYVSADIYNWWSRVLQEQQALEDRLHELRQQYGSDAVHAVILEMPNVDIEDHATVLHRMLDEAFDDDALDLEEIRRTMGRYGCTEEEAKKELRGIISLWLAEDYFGSWTDEEMGIVEGVDLYALEHKLQAEHPFDEAAGPEVPLKFVDLGGYLVTRYWYLLDAVETEEDE